jgi:PAS domain S-box-containing protein
VKVPGKLESIRYSIAKKLLLVGLLVSIPAGIASGVRIFTMGIKPLFVLDILIAFVLLTAHFTKSPSNYRFWILILLAYVFSIGIASIGTFGLFGNAFFIFFFVMVIITTLFGFRYGLGATVASVLLVSVFALILLSGNWEFNVDFNELSYSGFNWFFRTLLFVCFSLLALVTLGQVHGDFDKVNRALEASQERYDLALESVDEVLWEIDVLNKKTFLSKNFFDVLHFAPQEIGVDIDHWMALIHPDDLVKVRKVIDSHVAQATESFEMEYRIKSKDGGWQWLLTRGKIVTRDLDGKPLRALGIHSDIGQRKEMERLVMYNEQIKLNAILDTEEKERLRFASDLHDDIGPLLSSLNMYLSLLSREQTRNKGEIIESMQEILKDTIASVREISNNLSPGILKNHGLVQAVETFIDKGRNFINISLDENIGEERLPGIAEIMCYRIMKELFNNTLKYAQAENVRIRIHKLNDLLEFSYKDDGIGFEMENKFNEYHNGMGLKNILSRLNTLRAEYKFESEPGKGFGFQMSVNLSNIPVK